MIGRIKKTHKSAFTLIELLVIVAIISLLVSILLPSLNKARDLAKEVVCQSNLKGIGTALFLYQTECGRFPSAVWERSPTEYIWWFKSIASFLNGPGLSENIDSYEDLDILKCPVIQRVYEDGILAPNYGGDGAPSYNYNWLMLDHEPPNPGDSAMCTETLYGPQWGDWLLNSIWDHFSVHGEATFSYGCTSTSGRGNVLFADGHIAGEEFLSEKQIIWD